MVFEVVVMANEWLLMLGMALVLAGFLLIFAYAFLTGGGKAEAGGMVLIGPIPIIFGTSPWATLAAAAIGLLILLAALFLYFYRPG